MATIFEHLVRVRWRDTDAQGHVNHAVFLTYLEEGRDAFYAQVLGSDPSYVVVRLEVDLRAEVRRLDQQVTVRIQAERLGTTSLTTRETILTSSGEVAAEARVVTVRWDPSGRQPIPFNETERTRLTAAMAGQSTTRSAHELLTRCHQRAARCAVVRFERSAPRSLMEAAGCDVWMSRSPRPMAAATGRCTSLTGMGHGRVCWCSRTQAERERRSGRWATGWQAWGTSR